MKRLFPLWIACLALLSAPFGTLRAETCSDEICDWLGGELYAYGDWLYWTIRRSGLDYINPFRLQGEAIEVSTNGNGSCLRSTQIDFSNGYRLGIGYVTPCCLSLEINYTHYTTHDFDSFTSLAADIFGSPTRGSVFNTEIANTTFARMRYDVDYKVLDAKLGYHLKTRCFGTLIPFFGGRFAWIGEKADTFYQGQVAATTESIDQTASTHACGLMAGIDYFKLFICERFGVFASVGGSVLYNSATARYLETVSFSAPPSTGNDNYNFKVCDKRVISTLDFAFGLAGDIFCLCGFTLTGQVGYEWHQWLNMMDFVNRTGIGNTTLARNTSCFAAEGLFIRLIGRY